MRIGSGLTAALFLASATSHTISGQQPASATPSTDVTTTQSQKPETETKAQVSSEDTVSTFKLRVNLVQVHVVVRGEGGKPVEGLRKEDFQLFDNGKLQTISTFAVENAQSRKGRAETAGKTQESPDETGIDSSVTLPERFIALTFDDVHLKMEDAGPLRVAAGKFVDAIAPADRVGIFTTSGQLTLDFTSDKEALKRKLIGIMPRGALNKSRTECPNISYYVADQLEKEGIPATPVEPAPQDFQIFVQEAARCMPGIDPFGLTVSAIRRALSMGEAENRDTYRQLESVVRMLSAKPGTRILIFASPGFPLTTLNFEASQLVEHANRANIVINAIDARGVYAPEPGGDISQPSMDLPSAVGLKASLRLAEETDRQFLLMDFAYGTGGTFFRSNDIEGGLKQLGSVPDVSYVLGFSPQNQKMDGRYHTLKVTLAGQHKYTLQARRGYYAPKNLDDPQEAEKQEMQDAVFSKDDINDIAFTLQTQYFKTGDGGARLSVISHIGLKDLRFRMADGKHYNQLNVATVVFDDNGNYLVNSGKIVKLRLLDSAFEKWCSTGLMVKSGFDLKPGKYLIRQVVRDSEGAQMGAHNSIVVIPG
jgi:VWFA-related protein